jgi:hypothetical protein
MKTAEFLAQHQAATGCRPFASSIAALPSKFLPGAAPGIRMRVHVATTGPEPGNWLVAVEGGVCRVMVGSVPEPDARLYTDSDIGHSILNGGLSIDDALASRLLDYDGDPGELRRFGACFQLGERL